MSSSRFKDVVTEESTLREMLGAPADLVVRKQLDRVDPHARNFIAHAPFLLVGTANRDGSCDVSPRGDAPGFVLVPDEKTLIIPDRPGNRRIDSMRNILQTGGIGLLFVVPGVEETLRVNGKACVIRDGDLLDKLVAQGKRPTLAIAVDVQECFLHCAKAFKRSKLWQPDGWPAKGAIPTLAQMLVDQVRPADTTVGDLETMIAESYAKRLY